MQLNAPATGDTDSEAPIKPSYTEIDVHSNKLRELATADRELAIMQTM